MGNLDTQVKDWGSMFGAPITTDGELAHFGVLGMKWGVRKDRDKGGGGGIKGFLKKRKNAKKMKKLRKAKKLKAKLEKKRLKKTAKLAAKRQKLLEKYIKDPNLMYKNRDKFTTEEINTAMNRFEAEKKLNQYRMTYLNRGNEYISMLVSYGTNIYKGYELFKKFTGGNAVDKASAVAEGAKLAKDASKTAKANKEQSKAQEKASKAQEKAAKAQEKAAKAQAKAAEKQQRYSKPQSNSAPSITQKPKPIEKVEGEVVDRGYNFSQKADIFNSSNWRSNSAAQNYNSSGERYIESRVITNPALLLEDKKRK